MRFVCVAGARPNFMKIKPVVDGLEALGATVDIVHTGQHYDRSMSDVFFEDLGLRQPDHQLHVGAGSHAEQTGQIMALFEALLGELACDDQDPIDGLVVVGDVNSTLACAIVGAKAGLLVAHVEAGLRSRDWAMPEEVNRVVADRVSDLLFAPSEDGVDNLKEEGYRDDQIHLVGNVMIDTVVANIERAKLRPTLETFGLVPDGYALVTLHRPSNVDDPQQLERLVAGLGEIAERLPVLFPVHPRTRQRLEGMQIPEGVQLAEPQGYLDFLALQGQAKVVVTDSGGIQEETTALGVPCVTARESTERPITLTEGTNRLAGTDPAAIVRAVDHVLAHGVEARCPVLWDGKAGERVAEVLQRTLSSGDFLRPTDRVGHA